MNIKELVKAPPVVVPQPLKVTVRSLKGGQAYSHTLENVELWLALPEELTPKDALGRKCMSLTSGYACHTGWDTEVYVWELEVIAKLQYKEEN